MPSRGDPLSTTVKVVTAYCLKTVKQIPKLPVFGYFIKSQQVKFFMEDIGKGIKKVFFSLPMLT